MRVLVTGGAGFIGSHLVKRLLSSGHVVTVLDNLSVGRRENVPPEAELIELDVRSEELLELVAGGRYEAIVHLAGQAKVSDSFVRPCFDSDQNIGGTINVLEAARLAGVERVIFASAAVVYGAVPEAELPIKELRKPKPKSFYGLSKLTAESYLALYQKIYGLNYISLRFANVYGERQSSGGEGGVIGLFAYAVAHGGDITIYGDGEQTRDFVYVGDVAAGIEAALTTAQVNAVYNLSTQTETSLRELVYILGNIAGRRIIPHYGPERPGDIYKASLSNGRARMGLNWRPTVTLEEGLARTFAYFKEQK